MIKNEAPFTISTVEYYFDLAKQSNTMITVTAEYESNSIY
ncbi:hypothetical protein D352_02407 [Enterococcus faecium LA4B-2]|nr:hypothetical protein D352_02407 [Enterococcus faecium LA4B-2]